MQQKPVRLPRLLSSSPSFAVSAPCSPHNSHKVFNNEKTSDKNLNKSLPPVSHLPFRRGISTAKSEANLRTLDNPVMFDSLNCLNSATNNSSPNTSQLSVSSKPLGLLGRFRSQSHSKREKTYAGSSDECGRGILQRNNSELSRKADFLDTVGTVHGMGDFLNLDSINLTSSRRKSIQRPQSAENLLAWGKVWMEKKKPKKVTNGGPKNSPGKNNANGGADGTVPSILDEVKMLVSYKTRLDEEHLKPPRRASVGSISKPKLIGTTVSTSKSTIKLTGADSMSRSGSLDQLAETKMPMSKAKDQESLKLKLKGKKDYLCFDQTGVMTKKLVEQTVAREIQNANGSAAPVQVSSSTDEENQTDSDENTNNSGNNHNSDGIATWRPKAGTKTKVNVKNTVEQLAANLVYNLRHYNKGWFNKTASHYPEYFIEISSYERHARKAPPKEEKPEANDTPKKPASS